MSSHANISVFIPHLACPNDCYFCNQKKISGKLKEPSADELREFLTEAVNKLKRTDSEIAFFGGSFTGIPEKQMIIYLEIADEFVKAGKVGGIRLSTRPDYITGEILSILKKYNVTTIELGAQSMDNRVLKASGRGHTVKDTVNAAKMIKRAGFKLVLQLMVGLPGDSFKKSVSSAKKAAALKPDAVRIYPTLVVRDTRLERMYNNKEYTPLSLESAVGHCSKLLAFFESKNIDVVRLGLHPDETLMSGNIIAGPFHPAFRELCEGELFYKSAVKAMPKNVKGKEIIINISPGSTSKMTGQNKININRLKNTFKLKKITVKEDLSLSGRQLSIKII